MIMMIIYICAGEESSLLIEIIIIIKQYCNSM